MADIISQTHSSDRLRQIAQEIKKEDNDFQIQLPGLRELLKDYVAPNVEVSPVDYTRRLLKVFKDSTTDGTYSDVLGLYDANEKAAIESFVKGESLHNVGPQFEQGPSPGAREELPTIGAAPENIIKAAWHNVHDAVETAVHGVHIYDDAQSKNKVSLYYDLEWANWGGTQIQKHKNAPKITAVPQTSYGIQQIIKYAKKHDMSVRASGYRHSWSPIFGRNGQIAISTLGIHRSTKLPNIESVTQFFYPETELNSITMISKPEKGKKRLVRVGTAVTNEKLRRWCNTQKLDAQSTMPMNVIMVEITLGGSNAPICHGAGRRHSTLSDLVHTIEYVDCNGNMQTLSKDKDPELMKTAAGSFGLLGIVTHITLELEPMSYAVMTPSKLPLLKAVPLPPNMSEEDIPHPFRLNLTKEQRAQAQADFEARGRDFFYSEWFWFPYTSMVWVNCWNNVEDGTGAVEYPSRIDVFGQFIQTVSIQILSASGAILNLQKKLPHAQATLISKLGLDTMPDYSGPGKAVKTQLPNALHFRRAIQNVRVRDMEFEMPLQPVKGTLKDAKWGDEIDFSLAQQAWWDAILTAYRHQDKCPQRMPLEMRITGPSEITLAPFRGHNLGTCSIEVLTLDAMKEVWEPYAQEVCNRWLSYKDKEGKYLTTRPHWAKEWWYLEVRGQPMREYLKETYHDALIEFRSNLEKIAQKQGWNLEDARKRFSNELFDELVYGVVDGKKLPIRGVHGSTVSMVSTTPVKKPVVSTVQVASHELET